MSTVHLLPENLSNQIAAGEVVERPASVVKELVENALDAGAQRVFVEVEDGGRSRIKVVDDGVGMTRQDACLAILRHATSKISTTTDLRAIETLGFRGEALPSIASVSHFTITTRTKENEAGTRIQVVGGERSEPVDIGAPVGTTIDIRELFYNVPARLKFMKSRGTEMSHINQLMSSFALGNPEVHFRLTHNGRKTSDFPRERDLKSRIYSVLGSNTCNHLYETVFSADIDVMGFVSDPTFSKAGTQGVYTFVNGRQVRDKLVLRALTTSYGGALERGRYPYAVLYITMNPEDVDVNVHPTKHEVRFVHGGRVFECVTRALKMTLHSTPWLHEESEKEEGQLLSADPMQLWPSPPVHGFRPKQRASEEREGSEVLGGTASPPLPSNFEGKGTRGIQNLENSNHRSQLFLGEDDSIWATRENAGLVLVERSRTLSFLIYEDLVQSATLGPIPRQPLLFPEQFSVDTSTQQRIDNAQVLLENAGYSLESFGAGTLVLKMVPLVLAGRGQHEGATREILTLFTPKNPPKPEDLHRITAAFAGEGDWNLQDESRIEDALAQRLIPEKHSLFGTLLHRLTTREIQRWFGKSE